MARPGTVTGWKLARDEREVLLQRFPPKYDSAVADHVTLRVGATPQTPLPREPQSAQIVGRADDGRSLECMVVKRDGTTDRPDGSTYHITWSLDRAKGVKPVDSNAVIARVGIRAVGRYQVRLVPKFYPDQIAEKKKPSA